MNSRDSIFALTIVGVLAACSSNTVVLHDPDANITITDDSGIDSGKPDSSKPMCNGSSCAGCCYNNVCQTGTAASACGSTGQTCVVCKPQQICTTDQLCAVDPSSFWLVQPVSATISTTNNGKDWDFGGGAPDPYVGLWCPSTASMFTSSTPAVMNSFSPTWSTGGCVMSSKNLETVGFGIGVYDDDSPAAPDTIAPQSTIVLQPETDLLAGTKTLTNNTTLLTLVVTFTKQ